MLLWGELSVVAAIIAHRTSHCTYCDCGHSGVSDGLTPGGGLLINGLIRQGPLCYLSVQLTKSGCCRREVREDLPLALWSCSLMVLSDRSLALGSTAADVELRDWFRVSCQVAGFTIDPSPRHAGIGDQRPLVLA